MDIDIKAIWENAKNDPLLKNTLNVNKILENEHTNHHLNNKILKDICAEIHQTLSELNMSELEIREFGEKLSEFRLVDEIYKLHKGKYVRWIRTTDAGSYVLTNGGIVVDVKFLDNGTHILCKNKNRFIQYKFDDCVTFQKLTEDEYLILTTREFLHP